jgi:hypothetical protein
MAVCDLLMHIMAANREEQDRWEHTRLVVYNVAKFGNSDPKKFPRSISDFMPFEWDSEVSSTTSGLQDGYRRMREAKKLLAQKQGDGR